MLNKLLREVLDRATPAKIIKECDLSKEFKYNMEKGHTISENIFRPGSEKYFSIINEARDLYKSGFIKLNRYDKELLETDIGKHVYLEGEKVYLDFPFLEEESELGEYDIIVESCCNIILEKKKTKRKSKSKSKSEKKKPLNKPMRDSSGSSKYKVYVKDPKTGNIKTVRFGAKGMSVGLNNPKRVKSFVARHRCKTHANDKTKAAYWSCRLPRYFGNSGKKWW